MKYIAVEKKTAISIVNTRQLQSTEYAEGKDLVFTLKGEHDATTLSIPSFKTSNGIIFTEDLVNEECIIFDLELFTGFQSTNKDECLVNFQKTLRTAIKFWDNIPFGGAEKNNQESGFIILFPHPFSSGYSRVIIDKKPDSKRQEKRNGKHLLAFAYTRNEVNGQPSYTNFRKFLEEVKLVRNKEKVLSSGAASPVLISSLENNFSPADPRIGFEKWKKLLTTTQKEFVLSKYYGPSRIEGAAGTGKTLCLILKCIETALSAEFNGKKLMFVTHSSATKDQATEIITANLSTEQRTYVDLQCPISVFTLQEWCLEKIGSQIEESELLDKDAESSKTYQQILIDESLQEFLNKDFQTFAKLISKDLALFLEQSDKIAILASLMHEISEIIKGRAGQKLDAYKKIDYSTHALPIHNDQDAECIYSIYRRYQSKLEAVGNFDSDDIVISALNQLDSPIWRRRKNNEGFDFVFIDETHLFNLNELSVVHHILKEEAITKVTYSIDRSQSIGNSSLSQEQLESFFATEANQELKTVFRSSPDIIRLAFTILSAGSGFFTNLENPLDKTESSFTQEDESRSHFPELVTYLEDASVVNMAFKEADLLAEKIKSSKSRICIIPCNEMILSEIRRIVVEANKSCEIILKRGDSASQKRAERGGKYLVAGIDYVGGLEFDGVVIVGCDRGNFPTSDDRTANTRHFIKHASYNRLYVAITRAKYGVTVIASASRGISEIICPAVDSKSIIVNEKQ
ncbi:UvrD-helicase domain-containing protein [Pseudomonas parakoreensis]|uniref:UvrD-helicase domain-containing protein n=1 Tax=Pseudomonas parakoreensis TaxID=2892331 RepID=UPI003FD50F4E